MSLQVSGSFKHTFLLSPVFGTVSVVAGMFFSIVLDTASGATIVLTTILGLILILGFKKIGSATRQRAKSPGI